MKLSRVVYYEVSDAVYSKTWVIEQCCKEFSAAHGPVWFQMQSVGWFLLSRVTTVHGISVCLDLPDQEYARVKESFHTIG
jgi:hypothetical protein